MQLTIRGESAYVSTKVCRQAIRYFAREMFSKRLYKTVKITVVFTTEGLERCKAICQMMDKHRFGRNFTITINPYLGLELTLRSLAHEIVHVKQWATGELIDFVHDSTKSLWHGKVVYVETDNDYWRSPWEIDAYGREVGLFKMFEKRYFEDVT